MKTGFLREAKGKIETRGGDLRFAHGSAGMYGNEPFYTEWGRFQENMASVFSMESTPSEPPGAERDAAATIAPRRSASGSGRPW